MIHHVVGLFTHPDKEWRQIRGDAEESISHMYFTHTLILAVGLVVLVAIIAFSVIVWGLGIGPTYIS